MKAKHPLQPASLLSMMAVWLLLAASAIAHPGHGMPGHLHESATQSGIAHQSLGLGHVLLALVIGTLAFLLARKHPLISIGATIACISAASYSGII